MSNPSGLRTQLSQPRCLKSAYFFFNWHGFFLSSPFNFFLLFLFLFLLFLKIYGHTVLHIYTLGAGINIGLRLLIFGLFPRATFLITEGNAQKYSRLRCLLRVKGLVFCFYLGRSGSILQFRQNLIKVGSKSWLLTCSSDIPLSLPSYTGFALKRELNFCNGYLSLLYFC